MGFWTSALDGIQTTRECLRKDRSFVAANYFSTLVQPLSVFSVASPTLASHTLHSHYRHHHHETEQSVVQQHHLAMTWVTDCRYLPILRQTQRPLWMEEELLCQHLCDPIQLSLRPHGAFGIEHHCIVAQRPNPAVQLPVPLLRKTVFGSLQLNFFFYYEQRQHIVYNN